MKLPSGLSTKPDWSKLFRHVVATPSVPQLTVRKLSRVFGGSGFDVFDHAVQRTGGVANPGLPEAPH